MDTQTVLKIIELMDNRLTAIDKELKSYSLSTTPKAYTEKIVVLEIRYGELIAFRNHLQDYIENQVAHMETEQGM